MLSAHERQLQRVFLFLIFLGAVGSTLLLFEANFYKDILSQQTGTQAKSSEISFFVTLSATCAMFMMSTVPNYFIPSSHRGALRKFTAVLFANCADISVQLTRNFVVLEGYDVHQEYALRIGAILVLISSCGGFLLAFTVPKQPLGETIPRMMSLRGLASISCVICLLTGQVCVWAMKSNALIPPPNYVYVHNITPLIFAVLILSSNLMDDKGTQDMGYFFMVHYLVSVPPIFRENLQSEHTPHLSLLARLELSFLYSAAIILVVGLLIARFRASRATAHPRPPLTSYDIIGQIFIMCFAIAGAVLVFIYSFKSASVYSRPGGFPSSSPPTFYSRQSNYYAGLALMVPLFNLIGTLADFKLGNTFSGLLAFNLAPALASMTAGDAVYTPFGAYRIGVLMLLMSIVASPILVYIRLPGQPVDSFFGDMPMPRSPRAKRPTPMMVFWLWLLDAAYCWSESTNLPADTVLEHYVYPSIFMVALFSYLSQHENDIQRVVYFALLYDVTNPGLWPVSPFIQPLTFSKVFLLINGLWFVTVYSWDTPTARFDGLHEDFEALPQEDLDVQGTEKFTISIADERQQIPGISARSVGTANGAGSKGGRGTSSRSNQPEENARLLA